MAAMEFSVIPKEVKLMALQRGTTIHQYIARSHQVCDQHTQELVGICQRLGWLINLEKSELDHK